MNSQYRISRNLRTVIPMKRVFFAALLSWLSCEILHMEFGWRWVEWSDLSTGLVDVQCCFSAHNWLSQPSPVDDTNPNSPYVNVILFGFQCSVSDKREINKTFAEFAWRVVCWWFMSFFNGRNGGNFVFKESSVTLTF